MTEPLSPENLREIREALEEANECLDEWGTLDDDELAERVLTDTNRLLMEVTRLHASTTITKEKVEQGAEAFYTSDHTGVDYPAWSAVCAEFPNVADTYRRGVRAALEAVLNGGEDE